MTEQELHYRTLIYRALGLLQMIEVAKKRMRRGVRHPLLLPNPDILRLMLDLEDGLGFDLEVHDFIYSLFDDLIPRARPNRLRQIDSLVSDSDELPLLTGDER